LKRSNTTRAGDSKLINLLTGSYSEQDDESTLSTTLTNKERLEYEYLRKRDPMREFFTLTLKSVKLSSPHMSLIAEVKEEALYEKACQDKVPFFQWSKWLD